MILLVQSNDLYEKTITVSRSETESEEIAE